ncbi:hypothetical protein PRUPE_6G004800 [Prunus persica]|uniref:Uncharacterized protein n=1 Tax=Prunus persica TaxID=3760 RepID=M5WDL4_PRUPE|nr:hypothetical protein PRUPE_6G004800 [Prunus persica]
MVSESTTKNSIEKWSVAFISEETRLFQFVKCSSIFCSRVVYAWGSFCLFGFPYIVYYGFLDVLCLKFCSECALCFLCFYMLVFSFLETSKQTVTTHSLVVLGCW